MQPLRGDPDNLLPEGTNATDKASTPKALPPSRSGRRTTSAVFFHQREAHLRLPPPFCFFAPETSKLIPEACGNPVRHGTSPLRCFTANCPTVSHKQFTCSGLHRSNLPNRWQCPLHGGPGPPNRKFPPTTTLCDSCRLPTRRGTRPLDCDAPGCQAQVHAARRCSHPSR